MGKIMNRYETEENILAARSEEFIEMLINRGVIGKNEVSDNVRSKARASKKQSVYHNALLMLRNYRNII